MIGSMLGLNSTNVIMLNLSNLRGVLDMMASEANRDRLTYFGADLYEMERRLENCLVKGFKNPGATRKYQYKMSQLEREDDPNKIAALKQEIHQLELENEVGYTFKYNFKREESYILLWSLYVFNFRIRLKETSEPLDVIPKGQSILESVLTDIPTYSLTGRKLFGWEVYRLRNRPAENLRWYIRNQLHMSTKPGKRMDFFRIEMKLKKMCNEIDVYYSLIGERDKSGPQDIEGILSDIRAKLEEVDKGTIVLGAITNPKVVSSYCRVFDKDTNQIAALLEVLTTDDLQDIYDDMKDVIYGLNRYNVQFFDQAMRSVTFTPESKGNIEGLEVFRDVILETEDAMDSVEALFSDIGGVQGA